MDYDLEFLKKYEIIRTLGEGEHGIVYEARNIRKNQLVALKKVQVSDVDPDEIEAMMRLRDVDGVVQIYKTFKTDSYMYIVMSLCPNCKDLMDFLKKKITKKILIKLAASFWKILTNMYKRGVVHLDLGVWEPAFCKSIKKEQSKITKMINILVTQSSDLFIIDLGVCHIREEDDDKNYYVEFVCKEMYVFFSILTINLKANKNIFKSIEQELKAAKTFKQVDRILNKLVD